MPMARAFLCLAGAVSVFLLKSVTSPTTWSQGHRRTRIHSTNDPHYFHATSELTVSYPPSQIEGYQVSGIEANQSSSSARVFEFAPPNANWKREGAVHVFLDLSVKPAANLRCFCCMGHRPVPDKRNA